MALIDDPAVNGFADAPPLPTRDNFPEPPPPTPDTLRVFEAEWQTNNSVFSTEAAQGGIASGFEFQPVDPTLDLAVELKGTPYANDPGLFATARNAGHVKALMADIEREEQNRATVAASTWAQFIPAMLTGQMLDPINWLSLGTVGALKLTTRAALRTTAGRGLAIGAGVAVDAAAQEAVLHANQPTRTNLETASAIGGSLLLGGLIGGVGARMLLRGERVALEAQIKKDFDSVFRERGPLEVEGSAQPPASAGAMVNEAAVAEAAQLPAPTLKGAFGAERLSARVGPMQRTMRSTLDETRRAAGELAESPYTFKENEAGQVTAPRGDAMGRPGAVQTRLGSVWEGRMMPEIYRMRDLYLDYRGVEAKSLSARLKMGVSDRIGGRGGALSEVEFRQAVTDALNAGGQHEIPQVAAAAQKIEENFLRHVQEAGIESGVLKEGQAAIPRAYNTQAIVDDRVRFKGIVLEHLHRRQAELRASLDALDAKKSAAADAAAADAADRSFNRELDRARDQAARDAERPTPKRYEGLPLTSEEIDGLVGFWRFVNESDRERKPQSVVAYIIAEGGAVDARGDLRAMIGRNIDRPGLIRNADSKSGPDTLSIGGHRATGGFKNTLDDFGQRLWDEGFFPDHLERPTVNDVLDLIADDLRTGEEVRGSDVEYFENQRVAREFEDELASYGITPRQFRSEARLREYFGQKTAVGVGDGAGAAGTAARGEGPAEKPLSKSEERLRLRVQMEDGELADLADAVTTRLHGSNEGRTSYDAHQIRDEEGFVREDGLLESEDFDLPYQSVRDFIHRDSELLLRMMHRSMVPDIEIALRFGSADMAETFRGIEREAATRINAAETVAERRRISRQAKRDISDLASMRDRLTGRYALPSDPTAIAVRAGRFTRDAAIVTKMGLSALSSIPETGRLVAARGLGAVFSDLLYPMLANWSRFVAVAEEGRMAVHALDHYTAGRAMAMADGAEDWGNLPKVDRFSREATKKFMFATGLPALTSWQKTMSGVLSMKSLLEASEAVARGAASTRQVTLLSRLGISKDRAVTIAEQFAKHGSKDSRIWAPEVGKWDPDARAAGEALLGGIRADVNRLITTPGLETPNMAQGEVGKMLFLLKNFVISSYERVLVSGLQQNDLAFWSSAVVQFGLAMAVNEARKAAFPYNGNKRQKDFAERWKDPSERNQIFLDALDRSGILGWLPEVNAVMDKAAHSGLGYAIGNRGLSPEYRVGRGDLVEILTGPAVSGAAETTLFGVKLAATLANGRRWREADTRTMQRVIPFVGLPYIRAGLDGLGAEDAFNREMGAVR